MSETALTRLKANYVPAAVRASVYEVLACYIESRLDPLDGLRELQKAALLRNDRVLAETVARVVDLADGHDGKLGQDLLNAFDNASPAEIALLGAADVAVFNRAGLLGRAAAMARLQK
jgi:hypothetical protein